jgi:tetratricopeptide (TPR) repeat protein
MTSRSFPSRAGTNHARKLLVLMLLIASAPSIAPISVPVSADALSENQMILSKGLFTLLESSHDNASMLLELTGDNESLPLAYEKIRLGEKSANMALSLNSTGLYAEAYEKALEALELFGEAIIIALEAEPEISEESSPENASSSWMVQGALERAWDYLDEVNSTYQAQGNTTEAESHILEAWTLLQTADMMFAEENYQDAEEAVMGAMEALDAAMDCMMEKVKEDKADRAIKFLDVRRNSFKGLEEYFTQMQQANTTLASAVGDVFLDANNANQYIRTLIANGDIEEALVQLDEIHNATYDSLMKFGLSKGEMKELKALERILVKAERLSKKNLSGLEAELTGNGKALGKTDDDSGKGNSSSSGKGNSSSSGKGNSSNKGKGNSSNKGTGNSNYT